MNRGRSLLISASWWRGSERWLGRARVSSAGQAGGLLGPKATGTTDSGQYKLVCSNYVLKQQ